VLAVGFLQVLESSEKIFLFHFQGPESPGKEPHHHHHQFIIIIMGRPLTGA